MSDHRLVLPAREGQSPLAQLEIYHCTQEITKENLGRNDQGQGSNNHNLYCSDGMQIRICGLMSVNSIWVQWCYITLPFILSVHK